jgi:ABC-type oligopeptide transport system substrate-binding subunit
MKRIIFLLRVVALTVVLLAMSVVPASGTNTAGTNTAKYCNYGYHPPAAEAENYSGSP